MLLITIIRHHGGEAFAVHIEGAPSRFGDGEQRRVPPNRKRLRVRAKICEQSQLLRIGIQGSRGSQRKPQGRDVDFRN